MSDIVVFLDVDGIVADFFSAVVNAHNSDLTYESYPKGEDSLPKAMGLSYNRFWNGVTSDLILNLDLTEEAHALFNYANRFGETCFLTSPPRKCADARTDWIREKFPNSPYILSKWKEFCCAGPHSILVDDRDSNIEAWTAKGGTGILFPRPWNKRHAEEANYFPDQFHQEMKEATHGSVGKSETTSGNRFSGRLFQ